PLGSFISIVLACLALIIIKKLLLGKMIPGRYKVRSLTYLRYWIIERMIDNEDLEVLADSLYFPIFLRMLGANLGKRVEIAEVPHISPDLLIIDDESFTASWALIGCPK